MSSSSSSPQSLSSDPGLYVSILPNIKRKAINAGAPPQAFDDHLHRVLLIINGTQYSSYSEADKAWHIDLFMWEHYFTEPFPFLTDIDLHPNGNTSTTIIRNPCVPRPADIIFFSPPRVPPPSTPVRHQRNCYRGVAPEDAMPVPGLVMGGPPPMVYSPPVVRTFGQGQVLAWQRGVVGGGQSAWIGELHQDLDMERNAGQVQLPAVNHEIQSPKVTGIHRHYRKRQSLRQE
ncbi:hypothetical protein L207DRAFT_514315 [Hyaloscypha variabilis F]|uniref:Uncharacterized protein n=1 Tax=Hyaloscypha variabilis (strain UAMH 11265 / GT02V1 / F) TaxID=1149755 RepID=A0A2J6RIU0_HYAVF|nr:hypothetical protein L207DRAFT_514315 [Hyaloscypha variabilis F]